MRNPQLDGSSFYWEAGPTGVLLCHGFTATTTEVRLLAQALHAQGYSVAAPLLPGHGTSPADCNRYSWEDWYTSLEQNYQQIASRCQRVVVGGESTGALLVLRLAYQHANAAAILCYAPAFRLQLSREKLLLLSLLAPFLSSVSKPLSTDNNPWKGYSVFPLKGAKQLLRLQEALLPLLPQIHQPILIMQGKLDPTVQPISAQIVYDQIGSAIKELHWLENSTHCAILDRERDLAAALTLDFIKRVLIQTRSFR